MFSSRADPASSRLERPSLVVGRCFIQGTQKLVCGSSPARSRLTSPTAQVHVRELGWTRGIEEEVRIVSVRKATHILPSSVEPVRPTTHHIKNKSTLTIHIRKGPPVVLSMHLILRTPCTPQSTDLIAPAPTVLPHALRRSTRAAQRGDRRASEAPARPPRQHTSICTEPRVCTRPKPRPPLGTCLRCMRRSTRNSQSAACSWRCCRGCCGSSCSWESVRSLRGPTTSARSRPQAASFAGRLLLATTPWPAKCRPGRPGANDQSASEKNTPRLPVALES